MKRNVSTKEIVGNYFSVDPLGEIIITVKSGVSPMPDARSIEEFLDDKYYETDNINDFLEFFGLSDFRGRSGSNNFN